MKNKVPFRKAMKVAIKDMKPLISEMRKEKPNDLWWDRETWIATGGEQLGNVVDRWVLAPSNLDDKEIIQMNHELGLNTVEGIEQWYKK